MFEIVAVVFTFGLVLAFIGWWRGPDIPAN